MIAPKKSLGQHFLHDENILRKIAESVSLQRDDVVVEIGPGAGSLTKHLIGACARVVGVEVDDRAVMLLRDQFGDSLEILHEDILKLNFENVSRNYGRRLRVVGNIPYYITSEILFRLFGNRTWVHDATLMMQLEVAKRLVAVPRTKDYGILTVFTEFYAEAKLLFRVSRNSFHPKPEVDSALVRLDFSRELPECNVALFTTIVRSTFGKRRKTLRNGLRYLGFTNEQLDDVVFDLQRRPEDLRVKDFLKLTQLLDTKSPPDRRRAGEIRISKS